jgi:hypothetical protein
MFPEIELTALQWLAAQTSGDQPSFKPSHQHLLNALLPLLDVAESHRKGAASRSTPYLRILGLVPELEEGLLPSVRDPTGTALRLSSRRLGEIRNQHQAIVCARCRPIDVLVVPDPHSDVRAAAYRCRATRADFDVLPAIPRILRAIRWLDRDLVVTLVQGHQESIVLGRCQFLVECRVWNWRRCLLLLPTSSAPAGSRTVARKMRLFDFLPVAYELSDSTSDLRTSPEKFANALGNGIFSAAKPRGTRVAQPEPSDPVHSITSPQQATRPTTNKERANISAHAAMEVSSNFAFGRQLISRVLLVTA